MFSFLGGRGGGSVSHHWKLRFILNTWQAKVKEHLEQDEQYTKGLEMVKRDGTTNITSPSSEIYVNAPVYNCNNYNAETYSIL